jgi:hypothetical protein
MGAASDEVKEKRRAIRRLLQMSQHGLGVLDD